ncbi:MAG: class II fructose-bisphosphate aldolase [Chloroflexota bacterium]|nr:class II fructose-bisphosphate aldolase [Chloroflexota bacterium]
MSELLNGRELQKVFEHFCPFYEDGRLKPEEERGTILAANSNNYWESAAFVQLAAEGEQSPLIVQFSLHANQKIGADPNDLFTAEGITYHGDSAVRGAKINALQMQELVDAYGADFVAVALDHFTVPDFISGREYKPADVSREAYRKRVEDAAEFLAQKGFQEEADLMGTEVDSYLDYLTGEEYQEFRYHFLSTVEVMDPAWGMIDTEDIPPALNFVITRDIVDGVRRELNNEEMMLEAELGATGQSGDEKAYVAMRGEDLERFAGLVASFVSYTGGEGLAYDIGMKHAARRGERHEPDVKKLEVVQRTVMLESGSYVPFAHHGGTGTAVVPRGLSGKTNVNTDMLVAGSNARFDHFLDNWRDVRKGVKGACGTGVETKIYVKAVYERAKSRLIEARGGMGTYQTGPQLREALGKSI